MFLLMGKIALCGQSGGVPNIISFSGSNDLTNQRNSREKAI